MYCIVIKVACQVIGCLLHVMPGIALHIFPLTPGTPIHDLAGLESPEVLKGSHKRATPQ